MLASIRVSRLSRATVHAARAWQLVMGDIGETPAVPGNLVKYFLAVVKHSRCPEYTVQLLFLWRSLEREEPGSGNRHVLLGAPDY